MGRRRGGRGSPRCWHQAEKGPKQPYPKPHCVSVGRRRFEACLWYDCLPKEEGAQEVQLGANVWQPRHILGGVPWCRGLRRCKPQVANRRRRKGDRVKYVDAIIFSSFHRAVSVYHGRGACACFELRCWQQKGGLMASSERTLFAQQGHQLSRCSPTPGPAPEHTQPWSLCCSHSLYALLSSS